MNDLTLEDILFMHANGAEFVIEDGNITEVIL